MKNIHILLIAFLLVISCKKKKSKDINQSQDLEITEKEVLKSESNTEKPLKVVFKDFDWSKITVSNSEIGNFPYISSPKGMYLWKKEGSDEKAEKPYTKKWDFNRLIMFDGKNLFNAEGKRAVLIFNMEDKSLDFNQYLFDKSVKDYFKKIGAVQIFKGQINRDLLDEINKKEGDMTVYNHIEGDPWNSDPIRNWVLNSKSGKIVFQVWSNSASAEIGVVELDGFKQTIKAPTASEIKEAIDKEGKAVLHINFDLNKATLKPDGQKVVDEIQKVLEQTPDLKLSIEGHTDNTGNEKLNKELSEKRANTVKFALAGKGIDISRLSSKGFGAEKPLVANDTEENKAKNRRVELVKQ